MSASSMSTNELIANGIQDVTKIVDQNASAKTALPIHTRQQPLFQTALGADAAAVIQAMDQMADDIPEQRPEHQIALSSVGVERRHVPVRIADPFGAQQTTTIVCDVSLSTYIPSNKRGIHMSRIGNLIAVATNETYEDLQQYATQLAHALNDQQYGGPSTVQVSGVYSYVEPVQGWKPEKNKQSLESIRLHASASVEQEYTAESAGLTIAHITACPCVQQTYKHALLQSRGDVAKAIELTAPLFTHSQRCETQVQIENLPHRFSMKTLIDCLDQVLFRTQNTLPREHELLMVYRAHREPQFIEDAMRQVIHALYTLLASDEYADCAIKVHATSMESIHEFDIKAECHLTMQELHMRLG